MNFTEFDKKMRVYENSLDQYITPETYIVVRLDGRAFHNLVKACNYKRPFDEEFNKRMKETVINLMKHSGFNIKYGYTQSDEISLLLDLHDYTFNRKTRKINSILASLATLSFNSYEYQEKYLMSNTKALGIFDSRVIPLPNKELVSDYFLWREEDANRNWKLREQGMSKGEATSKLSKVSVADKNELLFQMSINYNDLPNWQKRGIGFYFKNIEKVAINKITNLDTLVVRRELYEEDNLPIKEEYSTFIRTFC